MKLKECGEESMKNLGKKINYKIDDFSWVIFEGFLSHSSFFLLLYRYTDSEVEEIVNKIKQIIINNCTIIMPEDAPHKEFLKRITARKLKHNRLKFFTTNYGMLFEQAANECGFTMIVAHWHICLFWARVKQF